MRRVALAGLLALLVALAFAPAAVAQMNDDQMMGEDDMMMQDDMMGSASASAMSSATASASATSSASAMSASAMDKKMNKKMMSASASASSLPGTGGAPLLPLLSAGALALMAGSGILAARLVRQDS